MELIIKKAKLTVLDTYEVTDEKGNVVFNVKGELVSIGKRLRINDPSGHELASVYKRKVALREKYIIDMKSAEEVEVFRIDTMRKVPEYRAKQLGWTLKGDFGKDLKIMEGLHTAAHLRPKRLSFGETLKLDIKDSGKALAAVALYLVSELDQPDKPQNASEK